MAKEGNEFTIAGNYICKETDLINILYSRF